MNDVSFYYEPNHIILKDITLKISENECIGIIGRNGVGKTTLIKLMNGLLKPKSGSVHVDGMNTCNMKVSTLSKKVGLIFQNPEHALFSETVFNEIEFSLKNLGVSNDELSREVKKILEEFNLSEYSSKSPFKLSGGQKKMLSIACVHALNPKCLILDEPTIGQDAKQKEKLSRLIDTYMKNKKSIIIVSHDLDWISEVASRIIILSDKGILVDGAPSKILTNKKLLYKAGLFLPQVPLLAHSLKLLPQESQKRIIYLKELQEEILKLIGGC